jgi:hypothetical protein
MPHLRANTHLRQISAADAANHAERCNSHPLFQGDGTPVAWIVSNQSLPVRYRTDESIKIVYKQTVDNVRASLRAVIRYGRSDASENSTDAAGEKTWNFGKIIRS